MASSPAILGGMTVTDPTSRPPETSADEGAPAGGQATDSRAARFSYANLLRSLLPLVLICLALAGWNAFQHDPGDPVREVDPSTTVQLAASRADYPVVAPADLPDGYRPTSARTDAGTAQEGDPVTLEIGYVTPSTEFAGFVVSDDSRARPVRQVLDGAREDGTVRLDGETWTRSTTSRGETALSRVEDGVTVVVTGSATEGELETVAAAVRPYTG